MPDILNGIDEFREQVKIHMIPELETRIKALEDKVKFLEGKIENLDTAFEVAVSLATIPVEADIALNKKMEEMRNETGFHWRLSGRRNYE